MNKSCKTCVYGIQVLNGWSNEFVCRHPEYSDLTQKDIEQMKCWTPALIGKWTIQRDPMEIPWFRTKYICSVCNNWNSYGQCQHCPDCGAKMIGDDLDV